MINTDLSFFQKDAGTKFFSRCTANVRARLSNIWPKQNKFHKFQSCKKKNSRFFTIFPDFISIFQTVPTSGKLLGKFQDFFKNSQLCTNTGHTVLKKFLTQSFNAIMLARKMMADESFIFSYNCLNSSPGSHCHVLTIIETQEIFLILSLTWSITDSEYQIWIQPSSTLLVAKEKILPEKSWNITCTHALLDMPSVNSDKRLETLELKLSKLIHVKWQISKFYFILCWNTSSTMQFYCWRDSIWIVTIIYGSESKVNTSCRVNSTNWKYCCRGFI